MQDYINAFDELYGMYIAGLITRRECLNQVVLIQELWNIPFGTRV